MQCYYYDYTSLPWNDAKKFCEKKGGWLVTVDNDVENNYIVSMVGPYSGSYYIGLHGQSPWRWLHGESSFSAWNGGEPNNYNGAENCVGKST
jgi:hypothetical protein